MTLNTAALTDGSIPGDNAALQLGLGEGVVVVDVASVLGGAYVDGVTEYFNQLGPNTRLFADAHAPTVPVADFVGALVQDVLARLYELIDIDITVSTLGLAELTIRGTLAQLLAGQGTVAARLNVLLGWVEVPLGGGLTLVRGHADSSICWGSEIMNHGQEELLRRVSPAGG